MEHEPREREPREHDPRHHHRPPHDPPDRRAGESALDTSRYVTPLGAVDPAAVAAFWVRAAAVVPGCDPTAVPPVETFGDTVELADELLELVCEGRKRATAGAYADYVAEGEPIPTIGRRWIATDGSMRPRAVLETTDVRIGPLVSVDDAFAHDEGEGDRSRAFWLAAHRWFFGRTLGITDPEALDAIPVVFERFTVRYQEP